MRKVNDIIINPSNLEVVLVVESPFKKEILNSYPLAGRSGKAVTNYLKRFVSSTSPIYGFSKPIGYELTHSQYFKLGIINVSLWALDKQCYQNISGNRQKIVTSFNLIRNTPQTNFKNRQKTFDNRIEKFLFNGFENRVLSIYSLNNNVVFVPCGYLANKFLGNCNLPHSNVISMIPHPSFNNWRNLSSTQFFTQLNRL